MMVENSSAGLAMLRPEVTVTVTREEEHQRVLARYPVAVGQQRRIAVALTWCRVATGKHRGEHAVEVRLDGYRVGELTYLMSQRYGPVIGQVAARGERPGCEAVLEHGPRGLELTLRLPRHAEGAVPLPTVAPDAFGGSAAATSVLTPVPASAPKPAGASRPSTLGWLAAAAVVVAFIALIWSVAGGGDDEPASNTAADQSLAAATTTTEPPVTTTTTTTTPPPPTTTTTVAVVPVPVVPVVTPTQEAPAPPPPPPAAPSGCDPNYSGCVPIASDVDCAGGSGNGPAYTSGPVTVIGSEIYDLDRDSDGVACE